MKKIITILLASSLALVASSNAAQEDPKKVSKSKPVQKRTFAPKQNFTPRTSTVHTQHLQNLSNTKIHPNAIQKQSQLRTNQLPAVQNNPKTAFVPNKQITPNVESIRARYKNFKATPNTAIVSARFNQNYRIQNAQNWRGPQYRVFSSYRPQWHDQGWWRSRYSSHLLLIGGGWYYWDAGYWYPAWGYDESAAYYPYDGPIYVGDNATPFDQVVADCQATLQEQGYYKGEVDGLMGPLTRQALSDFQRDHGLITTAALDQPTLSSLGLG